MTESLFAFSPPDGFAPRIGFHFANFEERRRRLLGYVQGLSPTQLSWYPNPRAESIGTLLLHIAGVERSWIGEDIARRPMNFEEWKYAFAIRYGLPQITDQPLQYYLDVLSRSRFETREILNQLTDADLNREVTPLDPDDPNAKRRFTCEWILAHVAGHEAHHTGQIALMKRLLPL